MIWLWVGVILFVPGPLVVVSDYGLTRAVAVGFVVGALAALAVYVLALRAWRRPLPAEAERRRAREAWSSTRRWAVPLGVAVALTLTLAGAFAGKGALLAFCTALMALVAPLAVIITLSGRGLYARPGHR